MPAPRRSCKDPHDIPSRAELERWWDRFCHAFERLTPIAEEYDIKLAVHPSDTPNVDTPFGGIGFHRIIDAFPSPNVGYVYCIGTRSEARQAFARDRRDQQLRAQGQDLHAPHA